MNPQCGHRDHDHAASTATSKRPGESATTSNTRTPRRCSRTRITSELIEALLARRCDNHRFQQGLDPISGTLSYTPNPRFREGPTELPKDSAEENLRKSIDSPGTLFRIDQPHAVHRLLCLAEHGFDPGPDGIGALHLPGEAAGVLDADGNVVEGASKRVPVLRYETDPRARARCIAVHGTSCQVCSIDFGTTYGDFADGYIHVHHKTPVHQAAADGEYELDPVSDLVPVCPNCHAMLHRHPDNPCSVEKLRRLIREATQP